MQQEQQCCMFSIQNVPSKTGGILRRSTPSRWTETKQGGRRKVHFSTVQVRYHQVIYDTSDMYRYRTLSTTIIGEETYSVDEYSIPESTYRTKRPSREISSNQESKSNVLPMLRKLVLIALIFYFVHGKNAFENKHSIPTAVDDSYAYLMEVEQYNSNNNYTTTNTEPLRLTVPSVAHGIVGSVSVI